jgi:hypothetical protein
MVMSGSTEEVEQFFDRYAEALLDRDEKVIADLYSVPSLIVFPDNVIAVSARSRQSSSSPPAGTNTTAWKRSTKRSS